MTAPKAARDALYSSWSERLAKIQHELYRGFLQQKLWTAMLNRSDARARVDPGWHGLMPDWDVAAVGVDACRRGWVAVVLRDQQSAAAHLLPRIDVIADVIPDAAAIAVDIPIGLLDAGSRQADLAAKRLLGLRQHSVFMTPIRAALTAPTHATATAISLARTGAGISQQAFALRSRIFEVEEWLADAHCGVWEVHPEVSFAQLLGRPARAAKKTWQGMIERRGALAACGIALHDVDPAVGSIVAVDDMLDAAVAAWSAQRILSGTARSLPDPPESHRSGRPLAIWA